MQHPTSKAVFEVVERFKSVLPLATLPRHLQMGVSKVNECGHECGTVHCHGGWYAVAVLPIADAEFGFQDGSERMAKDLGFESDMQLEEWASKFPEIWGNERAMGMFCDCTAFIHIKKRPRGALNLQHIIDHWQEVGERLLDLEKSQQPLYEDITKELAVLPVEEKADQPVKEIV